MDGDNRFVAFVPTRDGLSQDGALRKRAPTLNANRRTLTLTLWALSRRSAAPVQQTVEGVPHRERRP